MDQNHDQDSGMNRRGASTYHIKVRGKLNTELSAWFEGFEVTEDESHNTILKGEVKDQAALYGILKKIRNSGMELLSLIPHSNRRGKYNENE
ncbi:MAG: hypothetical protein OEZ34_05700 [Spirochaetia bacterium]|nr:hypothetical protein [Spirochaetia bacterium]